jgi:hypothetical protein
MQRVLDGLTISGADGAAEYRCRRCEHVLGAAGGDWRELAATFDEPTAYGEPAELASGDDRFVLRHHCCPSCALLLEVEMLPRERVAP